MCKESEEFIYFFIFIFLPYPTFLNQTTQMQN